MTATYKNNIDFESGELFIQGPGFSYRLSVTTDPFGVCVMNEVISQDNDGIYTRSGNLHKTAKTFDRAPGNCQLDC